MTERSEQIQILYEIVTSLDTELDLEDMLKKCLSIYVRKLNCSAGAVFKLNQYSQGENYYFKEIISMPRRIHNNSVYKNAIKQIPQELNKQTLNEFYKHLPTNLHISENQHCHIMNLPGFGLIIFLKGGEPLKVDLLNSLLSLNKEIADACKSCLNIEALKESEEKYRTVFENTGTAMIIIEEDKTIFMTNTQLEKISGYSKKEMENKMKWTDFIFPEDLKMMEKYHSKRRKAGNKAPTEYEFRLLDKKGNTKDIFLKTRMIPGTKKSVVSLMDITERKKAEEALSEAHNIINRSPVVAFLWKKEEGWPVEFVSENVKKLFGYSAQEFLERKISYVEIIYSDDLERVAGEVDRYSKKEDLQTFTHKPYRIITKNGDIKWIDDITYIRRDSRGIITHYEGIVYDINERKQLKESILKSEEKYRLLADNSMDVIWQTNLKLVFTYVSPSVKNIMGYTVDEWVGTRLSKHASRKEFFNMAKKALYSIKNYKKIKYLTFNAVMLRKDGTEIPVEITGKLLLNKKGLPIGLQGTTHDITERKQAEELIKDSEERLKTLFDYAPDAYYISDLKGNFIDGNKAAERLMGYKKEELIGKNFLKLKLLSLADIPKAAKLLAKNLRRLPTGPNEFVLNRKDKSKVIVEISTYPVKIKGRALALGIARDITERKQAEGNLKNIKDELEMLLDSVPAIIFYKDTEGKIIRANKALADSLKVPIKDIIGKTTEELFPKEQAENMRKDDKEIMISGKPKKNIIQPYTTPDGIRWLTTDKIPYKDKGGKITGVIGLAKDITVQRKSEEELKQSYQRLKKTMDASIETMSRILEAKDPYTSGHQQRVSQLATVVAKELNLSPDKIEGIKIASLIHDIGKIGLPTEILSKPTKLTDIEFSLIKGHSQIGYDILKSIEFSWPIAQIILQHHEKINGSGYPRGLKGDEILLEAKIICVADVVEAMSSHRPYRPALGIDKALEEISQNKGVLYDPEVVDVCLKLFKEKEFKFE